MNGAFNLPEHCRRLVDDPGYRSSYLMRARGNYRGIAGCFSGYVPEEIISAAGLLPSRIAGMFAPQCDGGPALPQPMCSFVNDAHAAAQSGGFDAMDVLVFPHTCDALKTLHMLLAGRRRRPGTLAIFQPTTGTGESVRYFAGELKRFGTRLCRMFDTTIDEHSLAEAIRAGNATRGLLRKIYHLRAQNPDAVKASVLLTILTAGLMSDRKALDRNLADIAAHLNDAKPATPRPRIMIAGPLLDNISIIRTIEECGAAVVYDDVTNGSRYCGPDVESGGDFYTDLARRYLLSAPSPTVYVARDEKELQDRIIDSYRVEGIIFIIQKSCDPHLFSVTERKKRLRQKGIRTLVLEIEHRTRTCDERTALRIESFIETMRGN